MKKRLEISVGEVYVSVKLHLVCGEVLEVVLEGGAIVDLGVACAALNLGARTVFVECGNSAVVEAEGEQILYVAVKLCLRYRECEEKKICGRALVISAIEKNLVYRFAVDLVAVRLGIAVYKEHLHSAVVGSQLLLPYFIIGAMNTCVIGLGVVTQNIGEVLNVLIVNILVSASLDVLDDYLLKAGGLFGKRCSVSKSVVNAEKIHIYSVDSVNVEAEMTDLEEDHILSLVGVDEAGLDNHTAHVVDGLLSGFVDKGILLLFGFKGEDGDVRNLAFIVILEILHQLALFFEELDSETVVSPYKQLVSLI